MIAPAPPPQGQRPAVALILSLALLSAVSPLATDVYLPSFPEMTRELTTTGSAVQLTLTTFMIGLGLGQLVIGPLSDALGRRRPLLIGTVVCLLAGIVCALAPSIEVLVIARFVQGVSGAAGVVIARAIITDITRGATTVRLMNLMMIIGGVMPVIAPMAGGAILQVADWRGIFWVITAIVAVMVVGILTVVPDSLPAERRQHGGLRRMGSNIGRVLRTPVYVGGVVVSAMSFATLFAYVSASPFVIQSILGLPTMAYSLLFGLNALGMTSGSLILIRLAGRVPVQRTLGTELIALTAVAVALVVVVLIGVPAVPTLALLFCATTAMGFILGNASAVTMRAVPETSGTGSALMGALQFGMGALVSPIVGTAGETDARPMAFTMAVCASIAMAAFLMIRRRAASADDTVGSS
ncbi:multidrug effflux MFS transporter [Kocuria palustris]